MRRIHTILILSYPLAAHFALLSSHVEWALWLLAAVSLSQLLALHFTSVMQRWAGLAPATVLLLCIVGLLQGTPLALFLPPVFILSGLTWLFASSLRQGREPVITTIARHVFQERDPQILRYTRRVTQVWCLFFLTILIETILLTLFAPLELWSLFANILNYLFIVLMFVLEYSYRRLRFPRRPLPPNLLQQLSATNWAELLRGRH